MQNVPFTTQIEVRVGDVNYGGHLGNDTVLLYFQEARIRFLAELGLSEMDIGDGVAITQIESFVQYKAEAFMGDVLTITVLPQEAGKIKFKLAFKIERNQDGKLVAQGYTEHAGFDYTARRIAKVPETFKTIFRNET